MDWKTDLKLEEAKFFLDLMIEMEKEHKRKACYFYYHAFLFACQSTYETILSDVANFFQVPDEHIPKDPKMSLGERYLFCAIRQQNIAAIETFEWIINKSNDYEQIGIRRERNYVVHNAKGIEVDLEIKTKDAITPEGRFSLLIYGKNKVNFENFHKRMQPYIANCEKAYNILEDTINQTKKRVKDANSSNSISNLGQTFVNNSNL